jgi:RNA polymerase sigma factor (sigma-70 family)
MGVSTEIDHLFRREAGRIHSRLMRLFGPHWVDLCEDAVQDTICAALKTWKFHGVPERPGAWLMRAAHNRAIDLIRRDRRFQGVLGELAASPLADGAVLPSIVELDRASLHDDRLALIFSCCHPRLAIDAQLALILKVICGFGLGEIAAAFFTSASAIEKRVTRAKAYLKRSHSLFDLDNSRQVGARLGSVHQALHLLFNEGYHSLRADAPVRDELCHEAIRLAQLIAADSATRIPATDALLALMYFSLARLATRVDEMGVFVPLRNQHRARWDQRFIALGFRYLADSATGGALSNFHLEAAIAAEHCRAPSLAETNWRRILELYDILAKQAPTPVVTLNHAIALSEVEGPARALVELVGLADAPLARNYPFLHAAIGEFRLALGENDDARIAFERAHAVSRSAGERHYYARRLQEMSALQHSNG